MTIAVLTAADAPRAEVPEVLPNPVGVTAKKQAWFVSAGCCNYACCYSRFSRWRNYTAAERVSWETNQPAPVLSNHPLADMPSCSIAVRI